MQHQQNFQQHPLLAAIAGNNYAPNETQRAHHPWHQHYAYGRPLLAAGSSHHSGYGSSASGHSGYGIEPPEDYEVQHTPPSGSHNSYHHPSAGSGPDYSSHSHRPSHYSAPHPPPHPTEHSSPSKFFTFNRKKKGSSYMSALTLLAFFFFVNLLQNCINDHVTAMNPTVMVLTATAGRNRYNKLAEMNSREQSSSAASSIVTEPTVAAPVASQVASQVAPSWQAPELVAVASPAPVVPIVTPAITLQTSPYGSSLANKQHSNNYYPQQQQQEHHHYQQPHDDDYNYGQRIAAYAAAASNDFYPNRTHIDNQQSPNNRYHHHHQQHQQQYHNDHHSDRHHYSDAGYPWSYTTSADHGRPPHEYGYAQAATNKRYSSAPWSSASLGAQSGVSSYLDNVHRHFAADNDEINLHRRRNHADDDVDADADDVADDQRRRSAAFYTRNN